MCAREPGSGVCRDWYWIEGGPDAGVPCDKTVLDGAKVATLPDCAGYGMTPIMMGLAADAGVPVRACPVPIPMDTLFAPPQGFRTFNPGPGAVITEADHVDVEVALSR